jgi:fluoride ion exporter CrcB/FEX
MTDSIVYFLLIALFGGLGSALRFVFSRWQERLPWGILMANILAAAAATAATFGWSHSLASQICVYGFAGGLSTFGSVSAQTYEFFKAGKINRMLGNAALQIGLPILATIMVAVVYLAGSIRPIG